MALIEGFFTLLARILLSACFLGAAISAIQDPGRMQAYMKTEGKMDQIYPQSEQTVPVLMWAAVVFLVVGGISVLFGYKARFGAFLLIVFLAGASYFMHPFWNLKGTPEYQRELIHFLKNLAIGGGLITVLARGAGRFSVDGVRPAYDDDF